MDTRDLNISVIMTMTRTGARQHTVVQEPARRLLCIFGKCSELIFCQVIIMGISATALSYGPSVGDRKDSTSTYFFRASRHEVVLIAGRWVFWKVGLE
jgi:hypothetical protein